MPADVEYQGAVRLIPPCLILLFLAALAAWFGFDLLHNQPGLTTTQKVASIGSATFTVMTIVALLVRAAMCTVDLTCLLLHHWLVLAKAHFAPKAAATTAAAAAAQAAAKHRCLKCDRQGAKRSAAFFF